MRTAFLFRSYRNSKLLQAAAVASVVAALGGCGLPESAGELPTDELVIDNDPPLSPLHQVKLDIAANTLLPFEMTATLLPTAKFDVVALQAPVRNQSRRGVCSIFSTIGLMEMLYKKAGMTTPDFSEQYLQWSVKKQVGAFANSEGSSDSYNLQAINKYGIPAESAWPYEPSPWTTTNDAQCTGGDDLPTKCYTNGEPPAAARTATKYKLPVGRWVSTSSIKNVIYEKQVGVVVGLDFFYQAWNHRHSTLPVSTTAFAKGYVLYPNATDITESRKDPAGHSVQLVGWDDNLEIQKVDAMGNAMVDTMGKPVMEKGFYLFKNSWGTGSFGVNNSRAPGYGWISYRYVSSYGSAYTAEPPVLSP